MAEDYPFADYLVFADESGDHGLSSIDKEFPVFVLACCLVAKADYPGINQRLSRLKFDFWGHDCVIFHERDIRKQNGPFAFLRTDAASRTRFLEGVNSFVSESPVEVFAAVIDKPRLVQRYATPWNPYEISLLFCMERILERLVALEQRKRAVHVIFESRGASEDRQLELEFRRIADNQGHWGWRRPDFSVIRFEPVFIRKENNCAGLQIADLCARPVGLHTLRPDQPNRAFDIVRQKLKGTKCFP